MTLFVAAASTGVSLATKAQVKVHTGNRKCFQWMLMDLPFWRSAAFKTARLVFTGGPTFSASGRGYFRMECHLRFLCFRLPGNVSVSKPIYAIFKTIIGRLCTLILSNVQTYVTWVTTVHQSISVDHQLSDDALNELKKLGRSNVWRWRVSFPKRYVVNNRRREKLEDRNTRW